jgi:hypothetical protein
MPPSRTDQDAPSRGVPSFPKRSGPSIESSVSSTLSTIHVPKSIVLDHFILGRSRYLFIHMRFQKSSLWTPRVLISTTAESSQSTWANECSISIRHLKFCPPSASIRMRVHIFLFRKLVKESNFLELLYQIIYNGSLAIPQSQITVEYKSIPHSLLRTHVL